MKIAIMGGTFNPIHYAHLLSAEQVRDGLGYDRILFIPSARPPHRDSQGIIHPEHRYQMTLLATADNPCFEVSRIELDRTGPSYAIQTIKELQMPLNYTCQRMACQQEIYEKAKAQGVTSIDAPVSGGDIGARDARLSIMVGGDSEAVGVVMPLLEAMGKNIVHQGGAGAGQHTKMCNQITFAGTIIGVCEALLYGYKAGLDLETMLSSISGGAAACWTLDNVAPRILERNFDPGFFVEHYVKDMGIALD